jgi:hypothetical protein
LTATIVAEGGDITVNVDDNKIPQQYQWSYATLIQRLSGRYTDFKMNAEFHKLRNTLEANKSLCHARLHNPNKKKSSKTKYYNPNILQQFDKHYTRKVPPKADATEPAKEVGGVFD